MGRKPVETPRNVAREKRANNYDSLQHPPIMRSPITNITFISDLCGDTCFEIQMPRGPSSRFA